MPFLRLQFGIQENSCARCKAFYWTPSLISEAEEIEKSHSDYLLSPLNHTV